MVFEDYYKTNKLRNKNMAVGIGVSGHHIGVGIMAPLLNTSKPNVIINKTYCPLTEKQATDFMNGTKYTNYVNQKIKDGFYYMDGCSYPKMQRKFRGDNRITEEEICRENPLKLAEIKEEDKKILMSAGIAGLPKARYLSQENPMPCNICTEMNRQGRTASDEECEIGCLVFCWPIIIPLSILSCIFYNPDKKPSSLQAGKEIDFF